MNAVEKKLIPKDATGVVDELTNLLKELGFLLYVVVDHAKDMVAYGAVEAPCAYTVIFGNPLAGSKILAAHREAVVDIPLRIGIYEDTDSDGAVIVWRSMAKLFDSHDSTGLKSVGVVVDQGLDSLVMKLEQRCHPI